MLCAPARSPSSPDRGIFHSIRQRGHLCPRIRRLLEAIARPSKLLAVARRTPSNRCIASGRCARLHGTSSLLRRSASSSLSGLLRCRCSKSLPTCSRERATFGRLFTDFDLLWRNAGVTITEVVLGFGISIVIAIPLGLLIALSRLAKQIVYPPIIFMQLIPKIAIAPLFIVWLGLGIESKVLLTLLLTFFPLLISSISGFQILDDRLLYLTRSMGASRWQTFRYLRFPAALPVIFSGLKTSATIAVTAAIVAEFVGANTGLGYVLVRATSNLDTTLVFAVLVVLTVIGIALNYIVEFAEWLLTPWQRSKTAEH